MLLAQNVTGNSGPSERQNWTLERTRTFHRPLRVLSPGGKQQCHRTQSVSKGARPKSPPSPAVIPGMRPPQGQPGFCVPSSRLCGSSSAICRTCPCIPPPLLTAQQWFRLRSRLQGFSALAPPGSQETFGNNCLVCRKGTVASPWPRAAWKGKKSAV